MNDGRVVRDGIEKQAKARSRKFLKYSKMVFAYLELLLISYS